MAGDNGLGLAAILLSTQSIYDSAAIEDTKKHPKIKNFKYEEWFWVELCCGCCCGPCIHAWVVQPAAEEVFGYEPQDPWILLFEWCFCIPCAVGRLAEMTKVEPVVGAPLLNGMERS